MKKQFLKMLNLMIWDEDFKKYKLIRKISQMYHKWYKCCGKGKEKKKTMKHKFPLLNCWTS